MTDLSLTIRPETPQDALAIERLHERTFGPGRYARTAFRIREGAAHLLELSFTARIGTLRRSQTTPGAVSTRSGAGIWAA